jgi:hypothetical protein
MRCCPEKYFPLNQGLTNQPELEMFKVAKTPMDKLAGAGRRSLRKITFLTQHNGETAPCRIACDTHAIDAAANHDKIDTAQVSHGCSDPS